MKIKADFFQNDLKTFEEELLVIKEKIQENKVVDPIDINLIKEKTDKILKKAQKIYLQYELKQEKKEIRKEFREKVGYLAYFSKIVNRGYEKPRGYPGDYKMLDMIYNYETPTEKGIGKAYDHYFQDSPYAHSVRVRKDVMGEILIELIKKNKEQNLNILDLACGPSREVIEILENETFDKIINFKLVDFDDEALKFSKNKIKEVGSGKNNIAYIKENVLKLYGKKEYFVDKWGKQDIVYSIGLIDYFPDKLLKRFILFCFEILKDSGTLVLSIKDEARDPFAPLAPNWFCDWEFVSRDEAYMDNILKELNCNMKIDSFLDKTGKIVFYKITKR